MLRALKWFFVTLLVLVVVFVATCYLITYHPDAVETVEVHGSGGEPLQRGQPLKVLSWNVQYMAGKNYVFYYDLPDSSGPDTKPSQEDTFKTLDEVARVIREEDPDVVLLQEVDVDSAHTYHEDQVALLRERLPEAYRYHAWTYYHRALYVPHPKIMGSAGMALLVISKHPIESATRYQLPLQPNDPLTTLFYFKRCVLECRLSLADGGSLAVLDTHLDAFAQGSDTMQRQVALIHARLEELDAEGTPWIIGGDFNLLPPGQRELITPSRQVSYQKQSELAALTREWSVIPRVEDAVGPDRARWLTHFPNDPEIDAPDRTIDYLFYSDRLNPSEARVRQGDTWTISDHLPLIATFEFKPVPQR
ncbi:MAG: endonuclease/exonuclease/phosphatase [Puniceicoccaceae bacterium 5H]|nr:MAG: endonuclease/exonuclease/phosphatase [Puniceicoccaceae bacterium 5H]